ncbi:ferredoxin [Candidatus Dojkabacteria bacterium]|nr:ferredoxin [Candidatus Dojkabacteria bacterium]
MSDNKKLKVKKELCTKCGTCSAVYPDVFEFAPDGSAKVKDDANLEGKDLNEISSVCPSNAIVVE